MSVLNILDVNSYLHTAHNVPELSSRVVRNCPVGGLVYVTRAVSYYLQKNESVVLAFDSKTDRKLLYSDYKKGRKKVPEVILQSEALLKFMTESNVSCVKVNGLEADDIIYNIVERELNNFDVINIHSADYDLCHNVRAGKVNFFSVNSNTMNVNGNIFCEVLSTQDVRVPYNMITAKKIFLGDSSDGISAFTSSTGKSASALFESLVDLAFSNGALPFEVIRSRMLIETLLPFMSLTEDDIKELNKRCDLFFPKESDFDYFITDKSKLNMTYYLGYAKSLKDYDSCRCFNYNGSSNPNVDEELFHYGNSYKSGEYHVDNNLDLDDFSLSSSDLFIRGL